MFLLIPASYKLKSFQSDLLDIKTVSFVIISPVAERRDKSSQDQQSRYHDE